MERKEFLKLTCSALAFGGMASLANSCSSFKVLKLETANGTIKIPLSEFLIENTKIIRTRQLPYDILVRKLPEGDFKAVVMKCSHQDWALNAGKKTLDCTYHGSAFDFDGKVLRGPAEKPLQTLKTKIENEFLILS